MGGHILLEDVPGTGKTVLAKTFAKVCNTGFGRVQFTPDLLPNDIIGTTIYDQESKKFFFRKGPLFTNFFLADEINRATPRTQAALLEAMAEKQITIENTTSKLADNFFVMATQNPLESHGTFPLPEAQLDRFTIRVSLGFLDKEIEAKMVKKHLIQDPFTQAKQVITEKEFYQIKSIVDKVTIDEKIINYIVEISHQTRNHKFIKHGVSPRATIALTKLAQAFAIINNRNYVIPADIYTLAPYVLNHRLILTEDAIFEEHTSFDIIEEILKSIKPPKL
ncbi:MAG: MoxR family ATPase [Halobacteriovoraceae bacterium]|nr:MoxR family ATPase [Halobacteriovoraceae bacterium]